MSGRYQRLADLLELTGMLRARAAGITIGEIAERFEVGRRTADSVVRPQAAEAPDSDQNSG